MQTLVALIIATSVLVIIPGPNVALIVANSLQFGFRMGVKTVLGTTAGAALQLAFVVGGLIAVIEVVASALIWIRMAGVVYLIWLGIHTWRKPATDLAKIEAVPRMFVRGCLLAAMNPKTLVFNAAFLPQFAGDGSAGEFALVGGVFLGVLFIGDVAWALFASTARSILGRYSHWRNRVAGVFLTAAGIGLALSRRA